jgi:hydrogenase nickel incorporation protein HypA/HybF
MHELSIIMQIIKIAKDSIPKDMSNAHVEKINLRVGILSCAMPENLRFCFEAAVKRTSLSETILAIEEVEARVHCLDCDHIWSINEPVFECEKCSSGHIVVLSGRELEVASIEFSDDHAEN